MTTINEAIHAGGYLGSVVDRQLSFEIGTVASGQVLKAGEVVQLSAGKLIAADGILATDGSVVTEVVGIMHDAVDATDGDVAGCTYLARLATVKDDVVTYPTESTAGGEKAAVIESLKLLNIRPR